MYKDAPSSPLIWCVLCVCVCVCVVWGWVGAGVCVGMREVGCRMKKGG